jgi:hypothetical protein
MNDCFHRVAAMKASIEKTHRPRLRCKTLFVVLWRIIMGWGSGSVLMSQIMRGLKKRNVTEETRKIVYEILIPAMQDSDWDTEMDCMGDDSAYDATLRALHPDWFEDDE